MSVTTPQEVAEYAVWFARRVRGPAREVAAKLLEQFPELREPLEAAASSEQEALSRYEEALERGLSDAEAREEGWPSKVSQDDTTAGDRDIISSGLLAHLLLLLDPSNHEDDRYPCGACAAYRLLKGLSDGTKEYIEVGRQLADIQRRLDEIMSDLEEIDHEYVDQATHRIAARAWRRADDLLSLMR